MCPTHAHALSWWCPSGNATSSSPPPPTAASLWESPAVYLEGAPDLPIATPSPFFLLARFFPRVGSSAVSGGVAAASAGAAAFALARRREKRRLDMDLERLLDVGGQHDDRSTAITAQCVGPPDTRLTCVPSLSDCPVHSPSPTLRQHNGG